MPFFPQKSQQVSQAIWSWIDLLLASAIVVCVLGAICFGFDSEPGASAKTFQVTYSSGTLTRQFICSGVYEIKTSFGGLDASFYTEQGEVRIVGFGSVLIEPRKP